MKLNINSPEYYSKIYGVDDEIYWMCRDLSKYVIDKQYSQIVDTVGIVPIIAPKEIINKGLCKEILRYDLKFNFVHVSKQMDYDEYVSADICTKKKLIVKNILKSVKAIKTKAKFDYESFEKDVLECLNYSKEDMK